MMVLTTMMIAVLTAVDPVRVALTFDDGLKDHLLIAAPELEKRGWRGTFNIVIDRIGTNEQYMTWDDVRELHRRGHEIATHTKSHPHLVKLLKDGKEREVRREIVQSRDIIADKTGFTPRFMCPPFVEQNEVTERICREEGLRQMLSCRWRERALAGEGLALTIQSSDTVAAFWCRLIRRFVGCASGCRVAKAREAR